MHTILHYLVTHCQLNATSTFVDVGSGIGKPVLHSALYTQPQYAIGIEIAQSQWMLAVSTVLAQRHHLQNTTPPPISYIHADINAIHSLNPCTHLYMFDVGFPDDLYQHIAVVIRHTPTIRHLVCYRPVHLIRAGLRMGITLAITPIACVITHMHGSDRQHRAYIYNCNNHLTPCPRCTDTRMLRSLNALHRLRHTPAPYYQWLQHELKAAALTQQRSAKTRAARCTLGAAPLML